MGLLFSISPVERLTCDMIPGMSVFELIAFLHVTVTVVDPRQHEFLSRCKVY